MELKCTFAYQKWPNGVKYTCKVETAFVTVYHDMSLLKGDHKEGYTNDDVEGLLFSDTKVQICIPKDVGKVFPLLKCLGIINCRLMELKQGALAGLAQLEVLIISKNELKVLHYDFFRNKYNLKWIDLSNNLIDRWCPNLLDQIKFNDFKEIDFRGNTYIFRGYFIKQHNNTPDALLHFIRNPPKTTRMMEQSGETMREVKEMCRLYGISSSSWGGGNSFK